MLIGEIFGVGVGVVFYDFVKSFGLLLLLKDIGLIEFDFEWVVDIVVENFYRNLWFIDCVLIC